MTDVAGLQGAAAVQIKRAATGDAMAAQNDAAPAVYADTDMETTAAADTKEEEMLAPGGL